MCSLRFFVGHWWTRNAARGLIIASVIAASGLFTSDSSAHFAPRRYHNRHAYRPPGTIPDRRDAVGR